MADNFYLSALYNEMDSLRSYQLGVRIVWRDALNCDHGVITPQKFPQFS